MTLSFLKGLGVRSLKFRLWDYALNNFVPDNCFAVINGREQDDQIAICIEDVANIRAGEIWYSDEAALVQYVGIEDINGNRIYEGDIVKGGSHWGNDDVVSYIEFRNNGFWVHAEDFGYEGEGLWDWDEIEVIGNIFENPELL